MNPQSWNRYAYALNNPLSIVDPTGRCGEDQGSGEPSATTENGDGSCGGGDTGNPIPPPQYDASITAQQSFDQFGNPCQCVLATINGKQVLIPTGSMIGPYGFMSSSADELNQAEQAYAARVDSIFADMYMDYFKYKGAYLKEESDCYWNNGTREIQYSLFNASGNPLSNAWVTEHQTDTSLTAAGSPEGPGTSSQGKAISTI